MSPTQSLWHTAVTLSLLANASGQEEPSKKKSMKQYLTGVTVGVLVTTACFLMTAAMPAWMPAVPPGEAAPPEPPEAVFIPHSPAEEADPSSAPAGPPYQATPAAAPAKTPRLSTNSRVQILEDRIERMTNRMEYLESRLSETEAQTERNKRTLIMLITDLRKF